MRILFAGTAQIAAPSLEAVYTLCRKDSRFELCAVLTNPDAPRGRKGTPQASELAAALERLNSQHTENPPVPVLKPEKLNSSVREQIASLKPDLLVCFAYGKIFGPKFLGLFPQGGINVHPSLLPRYRGAAPIPAAILNRDTETGVSIQRLALEMDSGALLMQEPIALNCRENTLILSNSAAQLGADMLLRCLHGLETASLQERPQDEALATYCSTLSRDDGIINWNDTAAVIDARIRANNPWPLCRCVHEDQTLFILDSELYTGNCEQTPGTQILPVGQVLGIDKSTGILIQTGDGVLAAKQLQYSGRKALDWKSFLNGARNFVGSRLL